MPDEPTKMDSTPSTSSGQESSPQAEENKSAEQPSAQGEQPADAQQVETELQKCQRERDEYLAGWQRAKADFLNYQKDEKKRLEEFLKFVQAGLIEDLLPVLDSFDSAQGGQAGPPEDKIKGFLLIKSQLDEILKKRGLEPIKSVGEKFNPEFHEAVATAEDKSKEPDTIVEEIQKGYKLNGAILRIAKVKVIK